MAAPIQHASNVGAIGPITVTLSATGANNTLLVYVGEYSSSAQYTVSSVTLGSTGDTIAKAEASNGGAGGCDGEIWFDKGASSGQTSLTVNFATGSGTIQMFLVAVEEWAGLWGPVDKVNGP